MKSLADGLHLIITNKSLLLLQIVDIGLGTKDDNAANVLALFSNVTNNTQSINTFSNMNASVHVLLTLSQKQLNPNESAFKVSITESLIIFVECFNGFQ